MSGDQRKRLSILILNHVWFADYLRRAGHRVICAGWASPDVDLKFEIPGTPISQILAKLRDSFSPDCVVYLDDSGPLSVSGLEELSIPIILYSIDGHHHVHWHKHLGAISDKVLVAQKDYLKLFLPFNSTAEWFPVWASQYIEPAKEKTIEACFRGNFDATRHPKRKEFFDELASLISVDARIGNYAEDYARSKIVINQVVSKDLNFRVFEAMMAGALLITPGIANGITELFEPGRDFVTYRNYDVKDAAEKISYYLNNEQLRTEIAENGRAKILQFHTEEARARRLEEILYEVKLSERKKRYYHAALCMFFASRTARKASDELGTLLLKRAASLLCKGAKAHEPLPGDFFFAIHLCKYELLRTGRGEDALALIGEIAAAYPQENMLIFSQIETLLDLNREVEARGLVKHALGESGDILENIPKMFAPMRANIVTELERH